MFRFVAGILLTCLFAMQSSATLACSPAPLIFRSGETQRILPSGPNDYVFIGEVLGEKQY